MGPREKPVDLAAGPDDAGAQDSTPWYDRHDGSTLQRAGRATYHPNGWFSGVGPRC